MTLEPHTDGQAAQKKSRAAQLPHSFVCVDNLSCGFQFRRTMANRIKPRLRQAFMPQEQVPRFAARHGIALLSQ
jgi:hypothetical protein